MALPRPRRAPRKIPLWAWYLDAWIRGGKKAPRPKSAPRRVPGWFWLWRLWRLARAKGAGSKAWRTYLAAVKGQPDPKRDIDAARAALVKWATWGIDHNSQIHYTEDTRRDDFLHEAKAHLPLWLDCSAFVTYCYWAAGLPDPSGLGYRWVGYTGTLLENAEKHGRVLTNMAFAKPGDPIVVGPGTGWHTFIVVKAGVDPIVASHGSEPGPLSEKCSADKRTPKRVCQILPT